MRITKFPIQADFMFLAIGILYLLRPSRLVLAEIQTCRNEFFIVD